MSMSMCCYTTAVEYSVEEPVNVDGNCSVESVAQCRGLVSQSPDFTAGNIDQLCQSVIF